MNQGPLSWEIEKWAKSNDQILSGMSFIWNILTLLRYFLVEHTWAPIGSGFTPLLHERFPWLEFSQNLLMLEWKKIWSVEPRIRRVVVSRGGEQFAESTTRTMTIGVGRKSEQRSLARRRRRAPRRRKLVSCFVAKVKTVTLLSALLVAALLVCERTRTLAKPSLNIGEAGPPSPDRNYIP